MESQINEIIKKVREIFKYNDRVKNILKENPFITLSIINDRLTLITISFSCDNSTIKVTSDCIKYVEENYYTNKKKTETLLTYKEFDDLLSM